jgi:hypothetical protein
MQCFRGVHAYYYAPRRLKVSWAEMLLAEPQRKYLDPASRVQHAYINSVPLIFVCMKLPLQHRHYCRTSYPFSHESICIERLYKYPFRLVLNFDHIIDSSPDQESLQSKRSIYQLSDTTDPRASVLAFVYFSLITLSILKRLAAWIPTKPIQ